MEKIDRKNKTYGEMMQECLAIKNQKDADVWFSGEVQFMKDANPTWTLEKCAEVVRSNLGYMAGYYDKKTSEHVARFFNAAHPVFGGPGYWDTVSPKEAFEKGLKHGKD